MKDEPAASDCSEGCVGFGPVPGDPWSEYGLCTRPGSPSRGFPVLRGRPCRGYFPRGATTNPPLLQPDGADSTNEPR